MKNHDQGLLISSNFDVSENFQQEYGIFVRNEQAGFSVLFDATNTLSVSNPLQTLFAQVSMVLKLKDIHATKLKAFAVAFSDSSDALQSLLNLAFSLAPPVCRNYKVGSLALIHTWTKTFLFNNNLDKRQNELER